MKTITVEAERLTLCSRTLEEMCALRDGESDPELKQAYGEMVELMIRCPETPEYACDWAICLKDGTLVGGIGFKGVPNQQGSVEIGYEIWPLYRRQGYAVEAVNALTDWALTQPGVCRVLAQTEPDNVVSRRVLARCGFQPCGMGEEGPLFARSDSEK